jgi:hypothetical protein
MNQKGFSKITCLLSFIKLGDLFIFGCGGNDGNDCAKGIAIYNKDLNLVDIFESKNNVICMKSIDHEQILLG